VGVGYDGKGPVHHVHLALSALHSRADVPPPASPGQVRQPLLEAAVEYWPAVLVTQGQELLHEEAGASGAAVEVGVLEHRGTNRGAGGQETVGCMINAQKAGNRGGSGAVRVVDGALSRLCMEAERY
jgi:hypothetical protein